MKRFFTLVTLLVTFFVSSCVYDDTNIWDAINDLQKRVVALEELCENMNSDIGSLQTIVTALQNNDYVTSVIPVTKDGKTIGYTITFTKSAPVTIYHGEDGKDGKDGVDGYTPVIGVKQDSDGIYYWTIDGEWLTDGNGNQIKAEGTDGEDGANGMDGVDGENGANGVDAITPELKIENDYWYVSYDNGNTWIELGKATGENGTNGADGKDGDSFFQGVDVSNGDYVVITLADGTQIKLPTWYAFEVLREQCEQMNKNITAMQQILQALQENDFVTSVQQIVENDEIVGYTVYFSKSGAVSIYHGKDGADGKDGVDGTDGKDGVDGTDGKDGVDGKDGHSPVVGVRQDADGIYYWTLDGEWLTDENGNKIKAVGVDGKDGADGADGMNGTDGITPQLKIENEYWYISYDNGVSWIQLDKATGNDGKDSGSFFMDVDTSNKNYVVLTLSDGTEIKVPTWYAFEQLQTLCMETNTNLVALQKIVDAISANEHIKNISPIQMDGKVVGYTMTFTNGESITIYNDTNDDTIGAVPQIGVLQYTDGLYYWTIDGEWLLDVNGNMVKAEGVDGLTPMFRIENEYWYISYDNGISWDVLGKATADDNGCDCQSVIKNVEYDASNVYITLADGTVLVLPINQAPDTPVVGGVAVDIGLSVLWATYNVGADSPEEYGDYFAWGEIYPKDNYTSKNSVTYNKTMSDISGYIQYDAATANWGDDWRIPTKAEMKELLDNCSWTWTSLNGVNGAQVTGPNGNKIFFPAAGFYTGTTLNSEGEVVATWSSTPTYMSTYSADLLVFMTNNYEIDAFGREDGLTIRPVKNKVE